MPVQDRTSRKGFAIGLALGAALLALFHLFVLHHWNGTGMAILLVLAGRGRMHDLGRSFLWMLVPVIALTLFADGLAAGDLSAVTLVAGAIGLPWLFLMLALPGQPGGNRYGQPPGGAGLSLA